MKSFVWCFTVASHCVLNCSPVDAVSTSPIRCIHFHTQDTNVVFLQYVHICVVSCHDSYNRKLVRANPTFVCFTKVNLCNFILVRKAFAPLLTPEQLLLLMVDLLVPYTARIKGKCLITAPTLEDLSSLRIANDHTRHVVHFVFIKGVATFKLLSTHSTGICAFSSMFTHVKFTLHFTVQYQICLSGIRLDTIIHL